MKFLVVILSFFSVSAFACPNLTGKYICKEGEEESTTVISRKLENGVYVYTVDDEKFVADGNDYPKPDDIEHDFKTINKKYNTSCNGEYLNTAFSGDFYKGDEKALSFLFNFKLSLKNKNLVNETKFTITDADGHVEKDSYTTECQRQ